MDKLSIKEWADKKAEEHRERIKYFIKEGIDKKQAVKMVLDESTLGQGYKGQIKYEFLGFSL